MDSYSRCKSSFDKSKSIGAMESEDVERTILLDDVDGTSFDDDDD